MPSPASHLRRRPRTVRSRAGSPPARIRSPGRALRSLARAVSWHRRTLAALATAAAVVAGLAAVVPEGPPTIQVVRAVRQLAAGSAIGSSDLRLDRVAEADAPAGAIRAIEALVGRQVAAPVAEGQVLTMLAVTSARALSLPGRVLAPLRLADADVVALLRPGDLVDIVAADEQRAQAAVVASGVRVVTVPVPADADAPGGGGGLVLIDVDRATAAVLARASVTSTLTVIWR